MKPITSEKTLYHPRAWVYVRAAEYGPALTELCESAQCAGYALVGQSYDLPQRFSDVIRDEMPCCALFGKGLLTMYSLRGFPSSPENAVGYVAFCCCFSAKASVYIQLRSTFGMTCIAITWTTFWRERHLSELTD